MSELEFRMLGALEVRANGVLLELGDARARRLLARLLIDANRAVSSDRLVDDLLGDRPSRSAMQALMNSISRLRSALAPDATIAAGRDGYELRIDWTRTDIHRFEQLAAAGRKRLAADDSAEAAKTLRLALDLWRGEPFGEFGGEPWARSKVARLEELRLVTIEDQIDAGLALDSPAVLPIVERLVALHPTRERLREQLMLALYNAGRQADALAAFQDARRFFTDEFGLDLSPQLRELHTTILGHAVAPVPLGRAPQHVDDFELGFVEPSLIDLTEPQPQVEPADATASLFDDWAFRIGRGEWPDPRGYLDLADERAEELRQLMNIYVRALPRPAPTQEHVELAQFWLDHASRAECAPASREGDWQQYRKTGDEGIRDRLILAYVPLVRYVVGRLGSGLPAHVDEGDLVSYGLLGLIGAIERYEPDRDVKFETYAIARIKGAIIDELRPMDWVPRSVRSRAREIQRAISALEAKTGRAPTDEEIAKKVGLAVEELNVALTDISRSSIAALAELWTATGQGDQVALIDTIEDSDAPDPPGTLSQTETKEAMADAIARLPEREKLVATLYYDQELTLREIGEVIGLTESRVSQLHTMAILRLKARLSNAGIERDSRGLAGTGELDDPEIDPLLSSDRG